MLRARTLTEVLKQVISDGVDGALLLNKEGALLSYAGYEDKDARMTAAIASSIWASFHKYGQVAFNDDPLQVYIMQCEKGTIAVSRVASALVVVHSLSSVPLGLLRAKAAVLVQYLSEPLQQVWTAI